MCLFSPLAAFYVFLFSLVFSSLMMVCLCDFLCIYLKSLTFQDIELMFFISFVNFYPASFRVFLLPYSFSPLLLQLQLVMLVKFRLSHSSLMICSFFFLFRALVWAIFIIDLSLNSLVLFPAVSRQLSFLLKTI